MICKNCGAENASGYTNCTLCGAALEENDQVQFTAGETVVLDQAYPQSYAQDPSIQQTYDPNAQYYNQQQAYDPNAQYNNQQQAYDPNAQYYSQPQPPKKKGKALKIILIILAALIAVSAVVFFCFKDKVSDLIMSMSSPEQQQLYVYKNLVTDLTDEYGDIVEDIKKQELAGTGEISLALSDTAKSLLSQTGVDVSALDSISITYDSNICTDVMSISLTANCNSTELLKGDIVFDLASGVMTASVPTLSDQAVKIDLSESMEGVDIKAITGSLTQLLPEEVLLEKLLPAYLEAALTQITGVEKASKDLTVGGVSQRATCYTTKFTEKTLKNVVVAIMTKAKTDTDLKAYIISAVSAAAKLSGEEMDGDKVYEEFIGGIDEALASLNEEEVSEDIIFTIETWADSSFELIGFKLIVEDNELFFGHAETDGKAGTEIRMSQYSEDIINATFTGTVQRDVYSGDLKILVEAQEVAVIKVEGLDTTANGFVGKLTISSQMIEESTGGMGISLTVEGQVEAENNTVILGVGMADAQFGTVTVSFKKHDLRKGQLHANATEDIEAWSQTIDPQIIMTKLEEAGLSSIIESIVSMADSSEDYYYEDSYDEDIYAYSDAYDEGYLAGYDDGYMDGLSNDQFANYVETGTVHGQYYSEGYDDGYTDGYGDATA